MPTLTKLLGETDSVELAEHVILAIGDLGDRGALAALRDLVLRPRSGIYQGWIAEAFKTVAAEEDYRELVEIVASGSLRESRLLAAKILAVHYPAFGEDVLWTFLVKEKSLTAEEKLSLLLDLSDGFSKQLEANRKDGTDLPAVSDRAIELLKEIVRTDPDASARAFWALFVFEQNDVLLIEHIENALLTLSRRISNRQAPTACLHRLPQLAPSLRPWLYDSLAKERGNNVRLGNLFELIAMVGDDRALEAISRNRSKLESACGRDRVDLVENLLRTSKQELRWPI